jgi:hypothetical protein
MMLVYIEVLDCGGGRTPRLPNGRVPCGGRDGRRRMQSGAVEDSLTAHSWLRINDAAFQAQRM